MTSNRPFILLACNRLAREQWFAPADVTRLAGFADWEWLPLDVPLAVGGQYSEAVDDPDATAKLKAALVRVDGLVVSNGSPKITAEVMDAGPRLRLVGETNGDRFAARIDVEVAWSRGIRVVDTTNGTSYPVAEWALGMMLIALRNAGAYFRRLIADDVFLSPDLPPTDLGYARGELTGKKVGLIGCGIIGRRLL
ncbi:MAG: hypothetical protein HYY04_09720 [Chloroflexi bacterium]|nr:hypothetical protein [Chloroflexota bacterium]